MSDWLQRKDGNIWGYTANDEFSNEESALLNKTQNKTPNVLGILFGVNYQFDANNTIEAHKAFEHNCKCCCNKGIRLDCDKCAIAYTHNLIVAFFADKENKND